MSDSKDRQDQDLRRPAGTGRTTGRKTLGSALQRARQRKHAEESQSPLDRQDGEEAAFSLGAALKRARLRQGLDLKDVEEYLRIRRIFLDAIEEDRFEDLPGPTYITAFLRSYAELLGIPFQDIMDRFEREAAEKARQRPKQSLPSPVAENNLPGSIILILGVVIAGLAYGSWVWFSGMTQSPPDVVDSLSPPAEEILVQMGVETPKSAPVIVEGVTTFPQTPPPQPSAPQAPIGTDSTAPTVVATAPVPPTTAVPADPAANAPANTESPAAAEEQPAPVAVAIPAPPSGDVFGTENTNPRIVLRAEDGDCWFRIREADGRLVTERILRPGQSYQVPNRPDLTLSVGNAGALKLVVDGTTLPPLGNSGQVRNGIRLNPAQLLPGAQN